MALSRFRDDPDGRGLVLSKDDEALLQLLDPEFRYSILPWTWAYAFLPHRDRDHFRRRIGRMARQPFKYLHKPDGQYFGNHLAKVHCYQRGRGGERYLLDHGHLARPSRPRGDHVRHQIVDNLVQASIELGARQGGVRFVGWRDILDHPNTPQHIREGQHPHTFRLAGGDYRPDGQPFVLSTADRDCAFLRETDRASEQLTHSEIKGSTIFRKIVLIRELFETKAYRSHYGFFRTMVLFTTKSERRMHKMMDLVHNLIGPCAYILFATLPDLDDVERSPEPTSALFDGVWHRAGHLSFSLATLS